MSLVYGGSKNREFSLFGPILILSSSRAPILPAKTPKAKKAGEMGGREEGRGDGERGSYFLSPFLSPRLLPFLLIADSRAPFSPSPRPPSRDGDENSRPFFTHPPPPPLGVGREHMECPLHLNAVVHLRVPPRPCSNNNSPTRAWAYFLIYPLLFPPSRLLSPPPLQLSSFPQTVSPRLFSPPGASTVKRKFTDTCGIGPGRLRLANFPQPFSPSLS